MAERLSVFRDRVELVLGDLTVGQHLGRLAVELLQEDLVLEPLNVFADLGDVGISCLAGLLGERFDVHGVCIGTAGRNFRREVK